MLFFLLSFAFMGKQRRFILVNPMRFALNIFTKDPFSSTIMTFIGGARNVIVVENGHGDTSSNPGQKSLHFT